jgi:hypothetical protein
MEAFFVSHRILYVAQVGPTAFPRFVICDMAGVSWDGSSWCDRPLLYADWQIVSNDCYGLQRAEAAGKRNHLVVEVPLRLESFSDGPLDLEQLRNWLVRNVSINIDFSNGSGPTPDSIVIGLIEWPRYGRAGATT